MLAGAGPLRLCRGVGAVHAALELGLAAGAPEGARPAERRPRQALPQRKGVRVPAGPGTLFSALVTLHDSCFVLFQQNTRSLHALEHS